MNLSRRMSRSVFLAVAGLALLGHAQWTQVGPEGGSINKLIFGNGSLVAASGAGNLFRSPDLGESWAQVPGHIPEAWVTAFAAPGNLIVAGVANGTGVIRSSDGGQTWSKAASGLTHTSVIDFAVLGDTLVAATRSDEVFASVNGGNSWVSFSTGLTARFVSDLAVQGGDIFAATSAGIYRFPAGMSAWQPVNVGVNQPIVFSIAVNGPVILAATNGQGVLRSTDQGATWAPSNAGLPNTKYASFVAMQASGAYCWSGSALYRSSDDGASWTAVTGGPGGFGGFAADGTAGFIAGDGGVYRSLDNGETWTLMTNGMRVASIRSMAARDSVLFISKAGGLFRSKDGAETWEHISGSWPNPPSAGTVKVFGNVVLSLSNGVRRSQDDGETWETISAGGAAITGLAGDDSVIFASTSFGMARSLDQGRSFSRIDGLPVATFMGVGYNGSEAFAAPLYGTVYRSQDKGASWAPVQAGLPAYYSFQSVTVVGEVVFLQDFTEDPGLPRNIFQGNRQGGGWTRLMKTPTSWTPKAFEAGGLIFATPGKGLYRSDDGGLSWREVGEDLVSTIISSLAVSKGFIYVSTYGSGIWKRAVSELQ